MKKYLDPKYTPVTALSGNGNGHGKVKPGRVKAKTGAAKKK